MDKRIRTVRLDGPRPSRGTPWASRPIITETGTPSAAAAPAAAVFDYQKPSVINWKRRIILIVGGLLAFLIVFLLVKTLLASRKVITRNATGSAPALAGNIDPTKLKGEGDGRINILLLGIGGPGHEGPYLSDTMMVMSLDPQTKDVAMLSIPRDMWVPIPGYGSAKINAADAYGEAYHYPGGGGALAKTTVSKVFDIPIHYYIRVDFGAFKQSVDAVGGVDVNVDKALYDDLYPDDRGGYTKPLSVSVGMQHMNGDLALKFARSRETTSDFDRAHRQQLVLLALKQKALTVGTLSNPAKLSGLIDSVGDHVKTDLQPNEIKKLAEIAKDIDSNKVTQKVLDTSPDGLLVNGNIGGGYVELPKTGNFDAIRAFVHSFFVDNYIKSENARVEVQNGTTRNGLAATVGDMLKAYNYNVTKTATAPNQNYPATIIYDYTGGKKPYTVHYLENRFHVKVQKATPTADDQDIKIILGADYRSSTITAQ